MKEWLPVPTGSGELGYLIEEAEASFLDRWMQVIEAKRGDTKPIGQVQRERINKRDGDRCVVPICRTPKFGLNIHHLIWRSNFDGKNEDDNLAKLCRNHHSDMHPGLREAFEFYRQGQTDAFTRYVENLDKLKYQPVPRVADLVAGIVYERNRNT